jgi:hypothetical protein
MLKMPTRGFFFLQNFARINAAHHGKLREVQRLALDIRARVEQNKFAALARNDRRDAAAIHTGNAPDLERRRRENAAGVAERNQRVGLASMNEFGRAGDGRIFFLAEGDDRFVIHFHHFAGVDHTHAMVAETAFRQRGVNGGLVADEIKPGNFLAGLERQLGARDHDPAAVVAAHDIHSDSHR